MMIVVEIVIMVVIVTVHVIKRMEMVDGMVVRVVREVMVVWVGAVIMC